jgi:hypothetical protein
MPTIVTAQYAEGETQHENQQVLEIPNQYRSPFSEHCVDNVNDGFDEGPVEESVNDPCSSAIYQPA